MPSDTTFDYARPFDIMCGVWTGISLVFTPGGEYSSSVASRVVMYWDIPGKRLRYLQREVGDLDDVLDRHPRVRAIVNHDFFLRTGRLVAIDPEGGDTFANSRIEEGEGKACKSEDNKEGVKLLGCETRPGSYLFHLHFPAHKKQNNPGGHYYNNQYFVNPNERHIIGPLVGLQNHDQEYVVAQTFTRVSYDVPEELRLESKRKR
jgi:hypothetical protein